MQITENRCVLERENAANELFFRPRFPGPHWGAYSTPPDPLTGLGGLLLRGESLLLRDGKGRKVRERGGPRQWHAPSLKKNSRIKPCRTYSVEFMCKLACCHGGGSVEFCG